MKISVRGSAERRYQAEVAIAHLAIAVQGPERDEVLGRATQAHTLVTEALAELERAGHVATWSADNVRVFAQRLWNPAIESTELTQTARLSVFGEFTDFEVLGRFLESVAGNEDVEVGGIDWNVTPQNRVEYEAEIRHEAVLDAIAKAQAYANAIGAGQVEATHLSDPGMLGSEPPMPRAMMAAMADSRASGGFELVPAEIVVRADVDAHFKAH